VEVRPVSFEGLTVEPRVMGDRFKYQGFVIRATGFATPQSGAGSKRSGEKPQSEQKAA
jgi:hypothetical protein